MNIEIYYGEHRDIPWISQQLKIASDLYSRKKPLYSSDAYVKELLTNMINKQIMFVTKGIKKGMEKRAEFIEDADAVVGGEDPYVRTGFLGAVLSPNIGNPDIMMLMVIWWWAEEKYRNGRSGLLLFDELIAFGKERADQIIFSLEEESTVNSRILTKRGFRVKETAFMLEVDNGIRGDISSLSSDRGDIGRGGGCTGRPSG